MSRHLLMTATAAALLAAAASASAVTVHFDDHYSVDYDGSTVFGSLSFWGGSGGGNVLFGWDVPVSLGATSLGGGTVSIDTTLPSFTITADPGFTLGGVSGFMGNLVFNEVGAGALTGASATGDVTLDSLTVPGALTITLARTVLSSGVGYAQGYLSGSSSASPSSLHSFGLSNAMVTLTASGGTFASITGQPQNKLQINLTVTPVPEPETYALMAAGLATFGVLALRRRRQR